MNQIEWGVVIALLFIFAIWIVRGVTSPKKRRRK